MRRFGFDTETFPIRPGRQAPRVVCGQTRLFGIELREPFLDRLETALRDPGVLLYGHHVASDVLFTSATRPRLWPLWLDAYDADRVTCTYEREKLIRIAQGTLRRYPKNGLLDLVHRYKLPHDFAEGDKEKGSVRTRYHLFDGIPPALWPADARRYAMADTVVDDVFEAQEQLANPLWLRDQYRQARAGLWLAYTSAWGVRVDPQAVRVFGEMLEVEHATIRELLTTGNPEALAKFCDQWNEQHPDARKPMEPSWAAVVPFQNLVRYVGSKDTKAAASRMRAVCAAKRLPLTPTKTGKEKIQEGMDPIEAARQYTSLDADATAGTLDPILIAYSRFVSIGTLRGRVDRLRLAAQYGLPIQPHFDALKETGRTSCSGGDLDPGEPMLAIGDQTQNPHRQPGLRDCYVARGWEPGDPPEFRCVFVSSDWKAAELHTLAQCCLDLGLDSNLARVLNSGKDVHLWFASIMLGWTYERAAEALAHQRGDAEFKVIKAARQGAKACDFGFPGGLGIDKFRLYAAKQYQVDMSDEEARHNKGLWLDAFYEMPGYFAHVNDLIESGRPLVHFQSGRFRGDIRYTSAANSYFQGRNADMLKDAGWRMMRSDLPARGWNEAHDEILAECLLTDADRVARGVSEIMEAAGRRWCPGCPPHAEPAVCIHWRKGAEPSYDAAGRFQPWEFRGVDEKTKGKIKKALDQGKTPRYLSWVHGFEESTILEAAA